MIIKINKIMQFTTFDNPIIVGKLYKYKKKKKLQKLRNTKSQTKETKSIHISGTAYT